MSKAQILPARPRVDYLKKLAKREVAAARSRGETLSLAMAQLGIARRYGFASWRKLKAHVEQLAQQRTGEDAKPINLPHVFRDVMKAIVRRQNDELTELLARAPKVVNETGPHPEWGGRPQPLHVAIETGNTFAFETLLNAGADIDGDNTRYDGWSPLMLAVHWKRNAMRNALIAHGARVGLIEALMLGDDSLVARLLKDKTILKGPFPNDATPLHFARTVKSAKKLIALGVNVAAKDKYHRTAAQTWALAKLRSAALMRLAASLGVAPAMDLFKAVEQGRIAEVRKLLAAGSDVNARFSEGSQHVLLHAAAWNGDLAMTKLLCAKGADVHAVDREHKTTPAHWARHALKVFNRASCESVATYLEKRMNARPTKKAVKK